MQPKFSELAQFKVKFRFILFFLIDIRANVTLTLASGFSNVMYLTYVFIYLYVLNLATSSNTNVNNSYCLKSKLINMLKHF